MQPVGSPSCSATAASSAWRIRARQAAWSQEGAGSRRSAPTSAPRRAGASSISEAAPPFRDRCDLDRIAPDLPLRITRVCGHALVANTRALEAAGLDPAAPHGDFPSGVLTESAMAPIYAALPEPAPAEWLEAARWACAEAARVGFVGVHSLMAHAAEIRALVSLRAEGPLPVRVRMQIPFALLGSYALAGLRTGFGDDFLALGAVKLFS